MDGNSPIGQDKSGNGNDFTPFNFGGSVALDNPQVSGAIIFLIQLQVDLKQELVYLEVKRTNIIP